MEINQVKDRLVREYGYSSSGVEIIAAQLLRLEPQLSAAFEEWWNSGNVPKAEIEGYSFERLQNEHGMNPIAAFLTLDWLLREPEKAKVALSKGHDRLSGPLYL